ncbi:hypothetical protein [Rhizobium paknamense]|uniref:Uncharacterized protein n=1 Tax=Rhizobium paknamense TaxID=1206817 RepID=A0ABU0IGM2_9HYPH|nr:hypothetical protein [Rhizobium paknamense]MDQ0457420.1 hypothetical protein [Rhizobium paknamense]
MFQRKLTPNQISKIEKQKERLRRERQRRGDELRRRIERLRRQVSEARRRRQRLLLLFLMAVLAIQESISSAFARSFSHRSDPIADASNWTPDPVNDFAPQDPNDDYCDGYSYTQWSKNLKERGICLSRKAERQKAWESDPSYHLFPRRYREWGYRPYIGQIMEELSAPYWRQDALTALKLLCPPGTHKYLTEAYATDPGDLRQCLATHDADIVHALQTRTILWEERKRREAEQARKAKNNKSYDDEKGFNP